MRTLPSGLATAIQSRTTSLARLCVITRRDGVVIRFTTAADAITHDGDTYDAAVALSLSAIRNRSDFGSTSCTLEIASSDNGLIDFADLQAGRFDAADVVISACDALNEANGKVDLFVGRLGSIEVNNAGRATIEMRGKLYRDRSLSIQKYTPHCRTDLGNPARCKVDLSLYTKAGTVSAIVSEFVIEITFEDGVYPADNYYNWGNVRWVTGANAGSMIEVRGWVQSTRRVTIMLPTQGVVTVGDTFLITAGCDKRLSTCFTRFGNQLNFRGEPHVPVIAGQATDLITQELPGSEGGLTYGIIQPAFTFRLTHTDDAYYYGGSSSGVYYYWNETSGAQRTASFSGRKPVGTIVDLSAEPGKRGDAFAADVYFSSIKTPRIAMIPPTDLGGFDPSWIAAVGITVVKNSSTIALPSIDYSQLTPGKPFLLSNSFDVQGGDVVYCILRISTTVNLSGGSGTRFTASGFGIALAYNL